MFPQFTQIITTSPVTGVNVFAIQILSNAVITSCTGNLTGFSGVTIPAGALIYCNLSAITLASGVAVLYKNAP